MTKQPAKVIENDAESIESIESEPIAPLLGDNDSFRHPLTALTIIAPLGLLAEIYRFLSERKGKLLAEDQWRELGGIFGIEGSILPVLMLIVGCLSVQIINRHKWVLPGVTVIGLVLCWGMLWSAVRYMLSFTSIKLMQVHHIAEGDLDKIEALAQIGLATSGAIQEELIFRAGILGFFCLLAAPFEDHRRLISGFICIPLSAAIFALAHTSIINHQTTQLFSWEAFVVHAVGGLLYGLIYLRQGLATCTMAHVFYNIIITFNLGPW